MTISFRAYSSADVSGAGVGVGAGAGAGIGSGETMGVGLGVGTGSCETTGCGVVGIGSEGVYTPPPLLLHPPAQNAVKSIIHSSNNV